MNIKEIRKYIIGIKPYIVFSAYLFLISIVFGFVFAQNNPEEIAKFLRNIESYFPIEENTTSYRIFLFIFENNASKILLLLPLGLFAGLFALFFILVNGFVLGIFAQVSSSMISWEFFILGIAPHGIIEIPVLVLATAVSLKIGKITVWKLFGKKGDLLVEFTKALRFYIFVLIPLLFFAALIEAYITPYFMSLVV
ncbi:stage II sporulation protein M [Candidatus Parcubacteria bacterium]|nr:stage II sporulation protein M [Candidatus Parcubacteria bacterium]